MGPADPPSTPLANTLFKFPFYDRTYPADYPADRLAAGTLVHVRFIGYHGAASFSPEPAPGSRAFCVLGGNPGTGVTLRNRLPTAETRELARTLDRLLHGRIDSTTLIRGVKAASAQVPVKWLHRQDRREETSYGVLQAVVDRLDLCNRLRSEAEAMSLQGHQKTLVFYLYLTCFNLLGQPALWMTFESWLRASRTAAERQEAEASLPAGATPVEAALHLQAHYTQRYGVKQSFFRFIDIVLPRQARKDLHDSVMLVRQTLTVPLGELEVMNEAAKNAYLFGLRNRYTHRAKYVPGVAIAPPTVPRVNRLRLFNHYDQFQNSTHRTTVQLCDWPETLKRTVLGGLAVYLERVAAES